MKLPAIFATLARSGASPIGHSLLPIACSSGRTFSIASALPAARIFSFAAAAMSGRPNTGAATYSMPRRACSAASSCASATEMVA